MLKKTKYKSRNKFYKKFHILQDVLIFCLLNKFQENVYIINVKLKFAETIVKKENKGHCKAWVPNLVPITGQILAWKSIVDCNRFRNHSDDPVF